MEGGEVVVDVAHGEDVNMTLGFLFLFIIWNRGLGGTVLRIWPRKPFVSIFLKVPSLSLCLSFSVFVFFCLYVCVCLCVCCSGGGINTGVVGDAVLGGIGLGTVGGNADTDGMLLPSAPYGDSGGRPEAPPPYREAPPPYGYGN